MRKIFILMLLLSGLQASLTRLYIGETDGQVMAGLDARINFGPFFIGGDIKTVIRKTVFSENDKVLAFLPDRTDYKTAAGLAIGVWEIEYAHTCYHRVISNSDISFYEGNVNPSDTDTLAVKYSF
ncbi:MAG: hypothetical protein LBD99_06400 [Candidatus Margulisbacteria bacterium]|jgi:hypothetical protein|nr:hypothetical protein [Candidatus Margulisiibacteriota bacterium]